MIGATTSPKTKSLAQDWRWKQIKIEGYPTVLIQPPINGQYGDPATVVFQQTGYDGDAEKLSNRMTVATRRYVDSLAHRRVFRGGTEQAEPSGAGQPAIGVDPPFTPATPTPNPTPYPNAYPIRSAKYAPRPFMGPALEAETAAGTIPKAWLGGVTS